MGNINKNAFYRGSWGAADVISSGTTVTLVTGEWKKIGAVKVPADMLIGLGYGAANSQDTALGRMYIDFKDNTGTPVAITGLFRIQIESSNDLPLGSRPVLVEYDIATLRIGSTSRSERMPLPFQNIMLSKDKQFVFYIKNSAASAQTLSRANSLVEVDITKQMV